MPIDPKDVTEREIQLAFELGRIVRFGDVIACDVPWMKDAIRRQCRHVGQIGGVDIYTHPGVPVREGDDKS